MFANLIQALFVLIGLILISVWLKHRGAVDDSYAPGLTRVVMDLCLPAVVFNSLSRQSLEPRLIMLGLIMLVAVFSSLIVAYLIGRLLRLASAQLGAVVMVAGFGSSASLGYVLIGQVFPNTDAAMVDAVVMNTLGSTLPVFLIGIPIAAYFGGGGNSGEAVLKAVRSFLISPLFFALVLGVAASFIDLPNNVLTTTLYRFLDALQGGMLLLIALTIGLLLRPISLRQLGPALAAVAAIKLMVDPWVAAELARLDSMGRLALEVLVIEAAMPSGTIAAVLAARYGCDGAFASALVVLTYSLSLVTTPLAVYFLA